MSYFFDNNYGNFLPLEKDGYKECFICDNEMYVGDTAYIFDGELHCCMSCVLEGLDYTFDSDKDMYICEGEEFSSKAEMVEEFAIKITVEGDE